MQSKWVLLDFKLEHQRRTLWTGWGELPLFPIGDPAEVTDVETISVTKDARELDQFLSEILSLPANEKTHRQTREEKFPRADEEHFGAAAVHSWLNEVTRGWFAGIQNSNYAEGGHNSNADAPKVPQSIAAFRIASAATPAQVLPPPPHCAAKRVAGRIRKGGILSSAAAGIGCGRLIRPIPSIARLSLPPLTVRSTGAGAERPVHPRARRRVELRRVGARHRRRRRGRVRRRRLALRPALPLPRRRVAGQNPPPLPLKGDSEWDVRARARRGAARSGCPTQRS